eukprot:gb/GEZN01004726.1/.p1 GENE.gb/GEZN01004726.1/~~gb/GEZN01004726.1/.p1  ORF type:complete len:607 (+),score=87.85 gb/GEZN01004726.1/:89-1909(+)
MTLRGGGDMGRVRGEGGEEGASDQGEDGGDGGDEGGGEVIQLEVSAPSVSKSRVQGVHRAEEDPAPFRRTRTKSEVQRQDEAIESIRRQKMGLDTTTLLEEATSPVLSPRSLNKRTGYSFTPADTPQDMSRSSSQTSMQSVTSRISHDFGVPYAEVSSKRQQQVEKLVDLQKELMTKEGDEHKENLNMVVIGHVDAGKSTLMGHLLYKLGYVSTQTMRRYEKESREMGKASFHFAWVMDENPEEKSRGVTVDVSVKAFETKSKHITLLDAPGHRDFIPHMISGAAQADVAILVVPAKANEFEAGFKDDGQTKEHAILARSLGINQIIVAINKLDVSGWSEERFQFISSSIGAFLKTAGFKEKNIVMVPVSGLTGENIAERTSEKLLQWWTGPTLLSSIDKFEIPSRATNFPFRMAISNVVKGGMICGKIDSGSVIPKDKVLVLPLNEEATIKSIEIQGISKQVAKAGDNVELVLKDLSDESVLREGQILCAPDRPVPQVLRFKAQIVTMNIKTPLLKGSQVLMHTGTSTTPAVLSRLIKTVDSATNEVLKSKPRFLIKNQTAQVEVKPKRAVAVELFRNLRSFGRFSLRRGTETVAVGIITKLYRD